jgi:hypothetical protein
MIETQDVICVLSTEGQPTKAILARTCIGVFFVCSVSDTIFARQFLLKLPANRRRLHGETPWTRDGPRATVLDTDCGMVCPVPARCQDASYAWYCHLVEGVEIT